MFAAQKTGMFKVTCLNCLAEFRPVVITCLLYKPLMAAERS